VVESRTTTTSCSALALIIAACAGAIGVAAAQFGQPNVFVPPNVTGNPPSASVKKKYSPFPSQTRWTLALGSALTVRPAFDGAFGYFPIEGDRIAAYDLRPGTLQWVVTAATRSAPVVGGSFLFLDPGEALRALRVSDGSVAWEIPFADTLAAPLVFADGWLFAATPQSLLAFQATDGSLIWRRDLGGVRASPAVSGDRLYVSLDDGRVLALRVKDGETVWERTLSTVGMPNEILALETQLFVGSTDNYLYCLKIKNGEIDWRKLTGADVISRPLADEDNVYFVSLDNVLRALNRSHGVQRWMRPLPFRPAWSPIVALDALVVAGPALPARAFFLKDGTPAETLTTEKPGDIVAPLHTFAAPAAFGPVIVLVTRSISGEASVIATSRDIEPPIAPGIAPLPNLIPMGAPVTSTPGFGPTPGFGR
jgi:outer membrane protein assembly factor BamB